MRRARTAVAAAIAGVLVAGAALVGAVAPAVADPDGAPPEGVWLAGDLHVHTCFSHDAFCPEGDPDEFDPAEFYTIGQTVERQFLVASTRALDYLAITDHNDVQSQTAPGFGSFGVIPVGGYENSLKGHAQMLGAHEIYDSGDEGVDAVTAMADELRADGGVFQVNHPAEGSTDFPHDRDWEYGYEVVPDTVEVWNISRLWQPPAPSGSSNDDAVRYWEGWLDRGLRVGPTGGSDNHYAATTAVQGVGQPTTWVFASEATEDGVLEGLRAGRTFISHQPPAHNGPLIFLEGDAASDGDFESIVGDAVPPGSSLRVRVEGAPGSLLRVITDGGIEAFDPVTVTDVDFTHSFVLPETSTWARAEIVEPDAQSERTVVCDGFLGSNTTYCRNALAVLAMTSAMYLVEEDAPIPTALTYIGETQARGEDVELGALLTDSSGAPVAGREVLFQVRDDEFGATTGSDGVARVTATIPDHGHSVTVRSIFAGDSTYLPSETTATITWGRPPGSQS